MNRYPSQLNSLLTLSANILTNVPFVYLSPYLITHKLLNYSITCRNYNPPSFHTSRDIGWHLKQTVERPEGFLDRLGKVAERFLATIEPTPFPRIGTSKRKSIFATFSGRREDDCQANRFSSNGSLNFF